MTITREDRPGESQARRLEAVGEQMTSLLTRPDAALRLREASGDEWSVLQVLGHMAEMIPYWLAHCRATIAAAAEPYVFGRGYDSPERLAGIERGARGDLEDNLDLLNNEVKAAARAIREMSSSDRSRKGIHIKWGELTVADTLERCIVSHAEEHLDQIRSILSG